MNRSSIEAQMVPCNGCDRQETSWVHPRILRPRWLGAKIIQLSYTWYPDKIVAARPLQERETEKKSERTVRRK